MILLDTNVLGRITDSTDPHYLAARTSVQTLQIRGERLAIVPQNLFEFWAVATRRRGKAPDQNGLGMPCERAARWVQFYHRRFTLLPDLESLVATWQQIVQTHQITGFRSHDARLVAAMQTYGIQQILTFNGKHFASLPITVLDPLTF